LLNGIIFHDIKLLCLLEIFKKSIGLWCAFVMMLKIVVTVPCTLYSAYFHLPASCGNFVIQTVSIF
jgi:hypothetical protein